MKCFKKSIVILIIFFCLGVNTPLKGNSSGNSSPGELFPDATFICNNAQERCGYSMSGAGDVNGDGFADFMIAAYHNYVHGWNSGGIYLITGGFNKTWGFNVDIEPAATAIFRGSHVYDMVGYNVAGKGDFNGDGFDDLIIGAPGTWETNPATPGWVYIVFGKKEMDWGKDCQLAISANIKLLGEKNLDQLGFANSFVGDINHDGFDDMICSAVFRSQYKKWDGKVYLILGDSTGWNETDLISRKAVASFVYPFDEALVGYSLAGVGDVNQDGTPDFVIGVPGANMACLILGRPAVDWGHDFNLENADYKFIGEFEGDDAGSWISHANDINNDGYSDLLISASKSFFNRGRIYLILGRERWANQEVSLSTADASFIGEDVETHTGFCTSGLKDYNGDGYDDFLIGARYLSGRYPHSGKMYLIKGRKSGWQHDYNLEDIPDYFQGDDSNSCAGWQVTDVGDVNGDNAHDFATSGPFNSTGDHWAGEIYFFYGKNVSYERNTLVPILPKRIIGIINSIIPIPLYLSNQKKVLSADIHISYDPEQLEFIDIKKTDLNKDFYLIFNVLPEGSIKIAMYTHKPVTINGKMIRLEFKGINKKKTNVTQLRLTSFRLNNLLPVSDETTVIFVEKGNLNPAIELSNQPNPFNPDTKIIYKNYTSGHGQLKIYDMLGKEVRDFDLGYLSPGVHELFWDGRDNRGIELTSGVYFMKFICGKDMKINKMIKLK
jgi:hypothetical protein